MRVDSGPTVANLESGIVLTSLLAYVPIAIIFLCSGFCQAHTLFAGNDRFRQIPLVKELQDSNLHGGVTALPEGHPIFGYIITDNVARGLHTHQVPPASIQMVSGLINIWFHLLATHLPPPPLPACQRSVTIQNCYLCQLKRFCQLRILALSLILWGMCFLSLVTFLAYPKSVVKGFFRKIMLDISFIFW